MIYGEPESEIYGMDVECYGVLAYYRE